MRLPLEKPIISVVIPAFNESQGIAMTVEHIATHLEIGEKNWEIIIVDDGSSDQTYQRVCQLSQADPRIKGIVFSRNFGKESALFAGLEAAQGQAVITIDADCQHPPALIPEMIRRWQAGAQIVHGVKRNRIADSIGKKAAAFTFNYLISRLGNINLNNSSDFKLLDREIVDILVYTLPEKQRFFRGLTRWLGFTEESVYFDVDVREGDHSKWSFGSLVELSITALTSFTSLPLRLITLLGILTLILGAFIAIEALYSYAIHQAVSGFVTIIITLLLIGSFVMISLGIIGEYIAKIYEEVKARPIYLVKQRIGIDDNQLPKKTLN